jgi:hypothetical protein
MDWRGRESRFKDPNPHSPEKPALDVPANIPQAPAKVGAFGFYDINIGLVL